MPPKKPFNNPLYKSTEPSTEKATEMLTETSTQPSTETSVDTTTQPSTQVPTFLPTDTATSTSTSTSEEDDSYYVVERRKRGKQAFEKTHDRWTVWLHKKLKKGLAQLAKEQEVSQSALADEAIADLLKKYGKENN